MTKMTLSGISVPEDPSPEEIMRRLSPKAEQMPSISAAPAKSAERSAPVIAERATKTISLPQYVWDQIRERSYQRKEPLNVVLMRALKSDGFSVNEEDLVDGRTRR